MNTLRERCCGGAIEQLIRAEPGWHAVFRGGARVEMEPVACWALVTCNGERHVHPIAALGDEMSDVTLAENYLGVAPPGVDPYTYGQIHNHLVFDPTGLEVRTA